MEVVDGQESRWKEQGEDGDAELQVGIDAQQVGFVIGVFAEQVAAQGQAGHEGRRDDTDRDHGGAEGEREVLSPEDFVDQGAET
jgi:hypothetical protein